MFWKPQSDKGRRSTRSVIIIVQNLPVPLDRRVWQEATSLRAAGIEVAVICPKSRIYNKKYERLNGIYIYRYSLPMEAGSSLFGYGIEFVYCWLMTFALALKAYLKHPFQVIQACSPPDTYFALALLFRPLGVKFVFDHHDLSPDLYVAKGHKAKGLIYRLLLFLEKATFQTADLVIAPNESYREVAVQRGKVPKQKLAVVRSGPRRNWARNHRSDPSLKQGRKYLVVFVGQIGMQDGVDYLLRAISVYNRAFSQDTLFAIIGDGPSHRQMVRMATELEIQDSVHFTGCLSDERLGGYLASADVCVDPDPWTQFNNLSTMNKIIEYMAFAKPIVAFDLLEHRRSAQQAAYYVEPNDISKFSTAIREVLEDKELQNRMSRFAVDRFDHELAWETSERFLLDGYTRVFAKTSSLPELTQGTHAQDIAALKW